MTTTTTTLRQYTVYLRATEALHARGTFTDATLLQKDYPEDLYCLVLDEYHTPAPRQYTYQEMRKAEYPSLADFADAMYWDSRGDSSKLLTYLAQCEQVKVKFPKLLG